MWRILSFLRSKKERDDSCEKLHGKKGKSVPFPQDIKEIDRLYGPVIRELSKR